jgi:Rrf2 family protein
LSSHRPYHCSTKTLIYTVNYLTQNALLDLPILGQGGIQIAISLMPINSIKSIGLCGTIENTMKISQKGLYALQAMMMLARHYNQGAIRIRDIAYEEALPEKFLELILLELKNARMVESARGAKGGYQLRRAPSEIHLSEIIRLIDGPLAPVGDAEQLRSLIDRDAEHRKLYQIFLDVRDAAAKILENTTLADIVSPKAPTLKKSRKKKGQEASVLPMVAHK